MRKQIDKDQKELNAINEDFNKLKNLRDKFSHNWRKNGIKDVTLQLLQMTLSNNNMQIENFELKNKTEIEALK